MSYTQIRNYAPIGNGATIALISKTGSLDWLCLPHMDSESLFCSILDENKGGSFAIQPEDIDLYTSRQEYVENTAILKTEFENFKKQKLTITDFMPFGQSVLVRKFKATAKLNLKIEFTPSPDFARQEAKMSKNKSALQIEYGERHLRLLSNFDLENSLINSSSAKINVEPGKTYTVVMQWGANLETEFSASKVKEYYDKDKNFWLSWCSKLEKITEELNDQEKNAVVRSAIYLKLLQHNETGAIAAASTTSLPEDIGGVRNWDYRFSWFRDGSMVAETFARIGYTEEATKFFDWLVESASSISYSDVPVLFGLHGKSNLPEEQLTHLEGYMKSAPVRIGNAAYKQTQLDVYGDVVFSLYNYAMHTGSLEQKYWEFIKKVAQDVCLNWHKPDNSLWEIRGKKKHYTHSKLMCWVALNYTIKIAREFGKEIDSTLVSVISENLDKLQKLVIDSYNQRVGAFPQTVGGSDLDSALINVALVGFLPPSDYRVESTMQAIHKNLFFSGLLKRYNAPDNLPGKEGAFLLSTFWLCRYLSLVGQHTESAKIVAQILDYADENVLALSEEIDIHTNQFLGNYPQAFSHLGLINAILDYSNLKV